MNEPSGSLFVPLQAAHRVISTIETHDNASSGILGENIHGNSSPSNTARRQASPDNPVFPLPVYGRLKTDDIVPDKFALT